jgi:drug/metabolite transporter (DMT)-like permease
MQARAAQLSHGQAIALMVLVTLMWSIAGVVTRQLEHAASFEVTFWRSATNALALGFALLLWRRASLAAFWQAQGRLRAALWISSVCWAAMFTCFMLAITLTTVANVLITMSIAPFMTALLAWGWLKQRVPLRTWVAIVVAALGIGWMYGAELSAANGASLLGIAVALGVPVAAAVNWNMLQRTGSEVDLMPAIAMGAVISAVVTLPLAWPFQASGADIAWLTLLGVVQLAIPCALVMVVMRTLGSAEASLLALLEVIFGIAWAWLGAGERPSATVLTGGALVLVALAANEALGLLQDRKTARLEAA